MPDIEPEEVDGLQEPVSPLKSGAVTHTLTKSISFDLFCHEVRPDRLEKLYHLCCLLDYYLVKEPSGIYALEFDLDKFEKRVCYEMLKEIKTTCLYDVKDKWYYCFLTKNCNLGNTEKSIKDGLRLRRR